MAAVELGVALLAAVIVWAFKHKKLKLRLVWTLMLGLVGILAGVPAVRYAWSDGRSVRDAVVAGSGHYCCSKAARSAAMPRAVWLFTAPRLIFIVVAISASDKSA